VPHFRARGDIGYLFSRVLDVPLKIPKEQLEALEVIISIPDKEMNGLLSALSSLPLSLDFDALVKEISPKAESFSFARPDTLGTLLISLNASRAHGDTPVPKFVNEVIRSMERATPPIDLSGDKRSRAKDRITKLLGLEPLSAATKANHLQHDFERLLTHSRILTDARPVYGQDPAGKPLAMIITHTLKLTYSESGDEQTELYLALDSQDITDLKQVLNRAEAKAKSLAKAFVTADIPVLRS
jgi:hypothetical protein